MDLWKGSFLPLRKHVDDAGFLDASRYEPVIDGEEIGTDEYWVAFAEAGYTIGMAKERAEELEQEVEDGLRDPEETDGILFVSLDGESIYYQTSFDAYIAFKRRLFDTDYYNSNIRIRPFPDPFGLPPEKDE